MGGGGLKMWGPKRWGLNISLAFLLLPPQISLLFLLSGVFSWDCGPGSRLLLGLALDELEKCSTLGGKRSFRHDCGTFPPSSGFQRHATSFPGFQRASPTMFSSG